MVFLATWLNLLNFKFKFLKNFTKDLFWHWNAPLQFMRPQCFTQVKHPSSSRRAESRAGVPCNQSPHFQHSVEVLIVHCIKTKLTINDIPSNLGMLTISLTITAPLWEKAEIFLMWSWGTWIENAQLVSGGAGFDSGHLRLENKVKESPHAGVAADSRRVWAASFCSRRQLCSLVDPPYALPLIPRGGKERIRLHEHFAKIFFLEFLETVVFQQVQF